MGATMENIVYGKWAVWIVIILVWRLILGVDLIAQPGFLSIDCGGKTNHSDENNIDWVTDSNYISVGETEATGSATSPSYLQRVRFFPNPLNSSCYQLPVASNVPHLLRVSFSTGNYRRFDKFPFFYLTIETVDMLIYKVPSELNGMQDLYIHEGIFVTSGRMLYICLKRGFYTDDPFINAIEMRTLQNGMYYQAKPGTMLVLKSRQDVGGNLSVRYPKDKFDRIWKTNIYPDYSSLVTSVSSREPISSNNTKNLPPNDVMQTAWVMNIDDYEFSLPTDSFYKSLLLLYFAEIEMLNVPRSFYVTRNGERSSETITLVRNYSTLELSFISNETTYFKFHLLKATNSTSRPIINAYEYYTLHDTAQPTYSQDIEAIQAIKRRFHIKNWISDPCFKRPWDGINCNYSSSAPRISEINFSGRNLSGSVPEDIGRLNALVNLTLDNNKLSGPLPNFSTLTMLERLHLQNNNLTGSVPDWLSELYNLKELFIENNNFSGVIPTQLLNNPSLILNYTGNRYLCMQKGECVGHSSKKDNVGVVLVITICGALLIALGLIVGIAMYLKKFRTKRLKEDCSMVMVLNPTKSRVFTLEEMVKATQNFNRKIGQGGFGSVFFGVLPEGKEIAVKVLCLFSKQGVHQFENEVDLLSRINHRNLVSLIGYCNESRDVMLIYEHMSGGSLRDHLYGPRAGISELNWKTRLKIALDAAQGLEYLHVGCTPKIIHRDVKTANILLDNNMNAKLADFGLSKMTVEGEASHVTTMVKGTPGYLDPEYFRTQMLTEKSDVYSLGVVLLEIICGRPPINASLPEEELNLIQWVTPYVEMDENGGEIAEIIDKRLGGNYDMKSMRSVAKLGVRCVEGRPSSRPSASEVVAEIKKSIIDENENNGEINLQGGPVCSRVDDMGWGDNSSNLSKVACFFFPRNNIRAAHPKGHNPVDLRMVV